MAAYLYTDIRVPELGELLDFSYTYRLYGDLYRQHMAWQMLLCRNPWSAACEGRGDRGGSLTELARHDVAALRERFNSRPPELPEEVYDFTPPSGTLPTRAGARLAELADTLSEATSDESFLASLARAYQTLGVGREGLYESFRLSDTGELLPTEGALPYLSGLIGCEEQSRMLSDNTAAFVAGKPSNNVLLYGDAGTGKSTSIRALEGEYYDRGLRTVEVYKHQFTLLPELMGNLRSIRRRWLIFIDDLSFEEGEVEYKYLKAVIEGGVEALPENVRIYATSNRRHLIRETWNDKNDMEHQQDIHRSDTVEEKLSLCARFGLHIRYAVPGRDTFCSMALTLARRNRSITLSDDEILELARRWELRTGTHSGRTAQQFADDLASRY